MTNVNGIDINPGNDIDMDLITVGVTGAPRLYWRESWDAFYFTKELSINGGVTATGLIYTTGDVNCDDFVATGKALIDGVVGIGTSSPIQTLTIKGTNGTDLINIASSSGGSLFYINESGNVGIGTTSPTEVLTVQGNVKADSYIEYSPKYAGNALKKIKDIKCEAGSKNNDWCKIDHDTLPFGVKYKKDDFVGRDLGKSVQLNLKAIQELYDLTLQQQAEIETLKMRINKIDNLGMDPVVVDDNGNLLSTPLWAGFGAVLMGLMGTWFYKKKR